MDKIAISLALKRVKLISSVIQTITGGLNIDKILTPLIMAVADGETAIKIQNAAGTTDVMTVDTVNNKVTFSGTVENQALQDQYEIQLLGGRI